MIAVLPKLDEHAHASLREEMFGVGSGTFRSWLVSQAACADAHVGCKRAASIEDSQEVKRRCDLGELASADGVADARRIDVDFEVDKWSELFAERQAVIPVVLLQVAVIA